MCVGEEGLGTRRKERQNALLIRLFWLRCERLPSPYSLPLVSLQSLHTFDGSPWPRFKGKLPRLASQRLINKTPAFLSRLVSMAHTLRFCQPELFIVLRHMLHFSHLPGCTAL